MMMQLFKKLKDYQNTILQDETLQEVAERSEREEIGEKERVTCTARIYSVL